MWYGLELDKDILVGGNTEYGPDTCCYVPNYVNKVVVITSKQLGSLPLGVTNGKGGRFVARLGREHIGTFNTKEQAHNAWQAARIDKIESTINMYATEQCFRTDVADKLMSKVWKLRLEFTMGIQTTAL